jgi:hypothetical protein
VRRLALLALAACAGPIDVTKLATPAEAAQSNGTTFRPSVIVRGTARAAVPPDTTFEGLEAHVPRPGIFTYALDPGEKVVLDDQKRVIGVKGPAGETKFIPGTATEEGGAVHGELEGHVERLPLLATDRIELHGRFAPGETVPTGGKVVTVRFWSAIGFGTALLGGAWLPSIIVAATSGTDADHWLYVPAIGPWIAYATRAACTPAVDPTPCFTDAGQRIGIIADGIIQSTGALLLLLGLPTSAEVRWGKEARVRFGPDLFIRGVF